MSGKRRHAHRGGWTIVEMLTVLALMSVVMLLGTKLVMTTLKICGTSNKQLTRMNGWNHAVATLRRDVWGAAKLELGADNVLRIHRPNEAPIVWQRLPGTKRDGYNSLQRTVTVDGRRTEQKIWPHIARQIDFAVDGPALILLTDRRGVAGGDRYAIVSQLQLAQSGESK